MRNVGLWHRRCQYERSRDVCGLGRNDSPSPRRCIGLFEPVRTHPDFQGKGLGKAVMTEGLRRMKAAGMKRAIVGFDLTNVAALALYTSMSVGTSTYFTFPHKGLS